MKSKGHKTTSEISVIVHPLLVWRIDWAPVINYSIKYSSVSAGANVQKVGWKHICRIDGCLELQ